MHGEGSRDLDSLHCSRGDQIVLPVAAKAAPFLQFGEKLWCHSASRGRGSARKSLLRVQ